MKDVSEVLKEVDEMIHEKFSCKISVKERKIDPCYMKHLVVKVFFGETCISLVQYSLFNDNFRYSPLSDDEYDKLLVMVVANVDKVIDDYVRLIKHKAKLKMMLSDIVGVVEEE